MSFPNKWGKDCNSCLTWVPKNAGIYDNGDVYCTEIRVVVDPLKNYAHWCCEVRATQLEASFQTPEFLAQVAEREATLEAAHVLRCTVEIPQIVSDLNMRQTTLNKIVAKITGEEKVVAPELLTLVEAHQILNELGRRLDSKQRVSVVAQLKSDGKCTRCGGAGFADCWKYTGGVCYKCNGTGKADA